MAEIPDMTFEKIVEKTKLMLGKNYREPEIAEITEAELDEITTVNEGTGELEAEEVPTDLEDVCAMVIREAAQWTNRFKEEQLTEVMNDCWPVIVKCSCVAYLNRGAEGLGSQSELGQQNVYNDWVALMHRQITNRRYII
jgi:hypothetical protein